MPDDAHRTNVAVALKYLKNQMTDGHNEKELLAHLNEIGSKIKPAVRFTLWQIRNLIYKRRKLRRTELDVITKLCQNYEKHFSLPEMVPKNIFETFVPPQSRNMYPAANETDEIRPHLGGLWFSFYYSPVDRSDAFTPEIRSLIFCFADTAMNSVKSDVMMYSSHTRWTGTLTMHGAHMYIVLREADHSDETAFAIVNRVFREHAYFSGVITALDRNKYRTIRPMIATLLFASRWARVKKSIQRLFSIQEAEMEVLDDIDLKVANGSVTFEELSRAKDILCRPISSLADITNVDPGLRAYAKNLRINNQPFSESATIALHLTWT